jgi:hypothetical protein
MKKLFLVWLGLASLAFAQEPAAPVAPPTVAPLRTDAELEQLLGPIALYPDALIALILPATTAPADIVLAARQMRGTNNDRAQVELRAWDDSVKSLTNYPDVLKWLDDNLEWTKQVGEAFLTQPADVMNAIQRLRAKARAAGTLVDTPQQQIISSTEAIRIVPAQRDVIYVPTYEPSVVYIDRPIYYPVPALSFGIGVPVGSWLAYDCDWVKRKVFVGDRHRRWQGHDWHRPVVSPDAPSPGTVVRDWRPSRSRDFVGPVSRTISPPAVVTPAPVNVPRNAAPRGRGFSGARSVNPSPVVTTSPALPMDNTPRPSPRINPAPTSRSLPNVISRSELPVAPPLPMALPSAPVAHDMGPVVSAGFSARNVAPSLPQAAPALPAVVPSFAEPPARPAAPAPAPAEPPARSHRDRRQQLD